MKAEEKDYEYHKPVLVNEVIEGLGLVAPLNNQVRIIDATLGNGGHTIEFIKRGADVLAIELDSQILKIAESRLIEACPAKYPKVIGEYKLVHGNFKNIDTIAKANAFDQVDAIIYDLGLNSLQYQNYERGFSFQAPLVKSAPLDMRIDTENQNVTASLLLNVLDKKKLTELFSTALHPGISNKISRKIIEARKIRKIETVGDFLSIIKSSGLSRHNNLSSATLPFLALRIAVNSELDILKESLPKAFKLLKKGGLLAVISFHSGEDKIVKDYFKYLEIKNLASLINKKPIQPSVQEVFDNPKSRSAKLRIIKKS